MKDTNLVLNKIKYTLLSVFLFALPLFFLPFVRDVIITSKYYLLLYTVLVSLIISVISLAMSKKIHWLPHPFGQPFILIILSLSLSIILMSPNKMDAIFNPHFGLVMFMAFIILSVIIYNQFSVHKKESSGISSIIIYSGAAVSILSLISTLGTAAKLTIPGPLGFLINPYFNTFGTGLELLIFQIFVLLLSVFGLMGNKHVEHSHIHHTATVGMNKKYLIFAAVIGFATLVQVYQLIQSVFFQGGLFVLPPFGTSWNAGIEVLKSPLSAVFGVGVSNFASIFTLAKTPAYNMTTLWQVAAFGTARSTVLHILAETGLFGLTAFGILVWRIVNNLNKVSTVSKVVMVYSLVSLLIFPPSFVLWFIFFVALILFSRDLYAASSVESYEINLGNLLPIYVGILVVVVLMIAAAGYQISRNFISELYFQKALVAAQRNDLKGLYENQRTAVILNPYNEDLRINFSRTNMILAINIASKKPENITNTDRQAITQAIQASISEAKAAVALNPRKATSWEYLGDVYRNIINVAQGSENWTVTAYQQATVLDPQNPLYRLSLGGIYYLFQNYDAAQRVFETAVTLKPDWANAYYNLAWTYYQKKDYTNAVLAMQQVLRLVDPAKEKVDYDKAQQDLETFRKSIPAQETATTPGSQQTPEKLVLPTPPAATVEPKLSLPPQASPEAR